MRFLIMTGMMVIVLTGGCSSDLPVDEVRTGSALGSGSAESPEDLNFWVIESPVIARLEIIEIGDALYNTQTGGPPGLGDEEVIGRYRLYNPITATVSHIYKSDGFSEDSIIFPFNHYIDPTEGVMMNPAVGDTGLAFISTNLGDVSGKPANEMARSPWVSYLRGISLNMNANGWDSDVRRVLEWFEYSGGQATEHRSGITLSVGDLESHVAALVSALP